VSVLDALALVPGLKVVNCSSELACAYAAGEECVTDSTHSSRTIGTSLHSKLTSLIT